LDLQALPRLTRRTYRTELVFSAFWGAFAGVLEGGTASVVAAKTFGASATLIAVVTAAPMFANLLSLIWGAMAISRPKVPLMTVLCSAAAMVVATVGLDPTGRGWSGWLFAGQMILARIFISGLITLRTAIWKANYPQEVRGRLAGRLQRVAGLCGLGSILLASRLFDRYPDSYVWVYPSVAVIGGLAALVLQRIRVRGDRKLFWARVRQAELGPISPRARLLEPYSLVAILSPVRPLRQMLSVLRRDRQFATYLVAVFCSGAANMMIQPVLTLIFVRQLRLGYTWASGLLDIVPALLMLFSVTLWARLYDAIGLLRFRVVNGAFWFCQILFAGIAAVLAGSGCRNGGWLLVGAVLLFVVSRMFNGLGRGGGAIAWTLGHLHFARPEEAELYMGIHVTLTGLRGMIAPFVGTQLFVLLGWPVFAVAGVLSAIGLGLYVRAARAEAARIASSGPSPQPGGR